MVRLLSFETDPPPLSSFLFPFSSIASHLLTQSINNYYENMINRAQPLCFILDQGKGDRNGCIYVYKGERAKRASLDEDENTRFEVREMAIDIMATSTTKLTHPIHLAPSSLGAESKLHLLAIGLRSPRGMTVTPSSDILFLEEVSERNERAMMKTGADGSREMAAGGYIHS